MTIAGIEQGEPLRWDLSAPIDAESIGLGESMDMVRVPDERTNVALTLPDGDWTSVAEQLTITPRHGYVGTINVFRTLSGGPAVHEQLMGDAEVLGFPRERIDRWLAELPSTLDESRVGDPRARTGLHGSNGAVVTSVEISHDPGPGGDERIRLWYAIGPIVPD
ncbi:hypothetical protein GE115_04120 [Agromyces sp. CFH 90414]|uniref:Uncharacterized protein n=1 Tax=Agromyces agglutinans TaxID=2662258 RepID=A0A6I2F5R1_9MICO|nr:hypothetical protein [Agromyces agglutinans]MRG59057.1 hypothetical protein [Agromyces agglutinans]